MLLCNENGTEGEKQTVLYIYIVPSNPRAPQLTIHTYILPLLFYPIELIINGETREHEKQTNKLRIHATHQRKNERKTQERASERARVRTKE